MIEQYPKEELNEKIIQIKRVSKVVKGGRRFSFNALAVVGDFQGRVGIGFGKANEVPEAVRKSVEDAKKNMIKVHVRRGTIPYEVIGKFKASRVLLKPASPGTGIIASSHVRAVVERAGIKDILTKSLKSDNPLNVVKAAFEGLKQLESYEQIAKRRGISIQKMIQSSPPSRINNDSEGGGDGQADQSE